MTRRPPRPCSADPLCPELVIGGGPCERHSKAREEQRPSSTNRGYNARWRATRTAYLETMRAQHPRGLAWCEECKLTEDVLEHPLEVDHIDGLGPLGPRGHDPANLQALCRAHHQAKTAYQTNTRGGPR